MSAPGTTPGPWRQVAGGFYGDKAFGIAGATQPSGGDGEVVCVITKADNASEEDVANACLIAASQDLYDTLDALVAAARNSFPSEEIDRGPLVRALAAAGEALDKARGEA